MKAETKVNLAKSLSTDAHADAGEKNIWQNPELLAPLLQRLIPELQDLDVYEIVSMIEKRDFLDDEILSDAPSSIKTLNGEFESVVEKLIRFDLLFEFDLPGSVHHRKRKGNLRKIKKIFIDLEPQHDYYPKNPSYPIEMRMMYYLARLLSRQLGNITAKTNYRSLRKVYSIWICNFGVPEGFQNTISRYRMIKEDVVGVADTRKTDYDLLEGIIIRRGVELSNEDIFKYLNAVYNGDLSTINQYVDTSGNEILEKEVSKMSYSTAIRRQATEETKKQATKALMQKLIPMVQQNIIPLKEASLLADKTEKGFVCEAKKFGFDLSEFLDKE